MGQQWSLSKQGFAGHFFGQVRLGQRAAIICSGLAYDNSLILYGAVEKSRQRRSRQFSVLTYCQYAPRAKLAVALLCGPFDNAQGMLF